MVAVVIGDDRSSTLLLGRLVDDLAGLYMSVTSVSLATRRRSMPVTRAPETSPGTSRLRRNLDTYRRARRCGRGAAAENPIIKWPPSAAVDRVSDLRTNVFLDPFPYARLPHLKNAKSACVVGL